MNTKEFLVWGGRGHAKVIRDLLALNHRQVVAIIDNDRDLPSPFPDVNIFYGEEGFRTFLKSRVNIVGSEISLGGVVAIGGIKGRERADIYQLMIKEGLDVKTLIHPSSIITSSTLVGKGSQILANVFVGSEVVIGDFCILNSSSSIDHDCSLGVGVHIAPGAVLAGEVAVDDYVFIGANATILPGLKIGSGAVIGAGAVVTRDIPSGLCVAGSPAVPLKKFSLRRIKIKKWS